eukprot:9989739-Alexandrium_andersonii.AAC.1
MPRARCGRAVLRGVCCPRNQAAGGGHPGGARGDAPKAPKEPAASGHRQLPGSARSCRPTARRSR